MSSDSSPNRREFPRISKGFFIHFRLYEPSKKGIWNVSTLHNISFGGCSFRSNTSYKLGDVLELRIKLPGVSEPMIFHAQTRHCEPPASTKALSGGGTFDKYELRLQFLKMEASKLRDLSRVIEYNLKNIPLP